MQNSHQNANMTLSRWPTFIDLVIIFRHAEIINNSYTFWTSNYFQFFYGNLFLLPWDRRLMLFWRRKKNVAIIISIGLSNAENFHSYEEKIKFVKCVDCKSQMLAKCLKVLILLSFAVISLWPSIVQLTYSQPDRMYKIRSKYLSSNRRG